MAVTRTATVIPIQAVFRVAPGKPPVLDMPGEIDTYHGINKLVISLSTDPPDAQDSATFANDPPGAVCWVDPGGESIPTPQSFHVVRQDRELVIWDVNGTSYGRAFHFWIAVQYEGRIYYLDPTIINQKTGQFRER
jgi:hypothetical protein